MELNTPKVLQGRRKSATKMGPQSLLHVKEKKDKRNKAACVLWRALQIILPV